MSTFSIKCAAAIFKIFQKFVEKYFNMEFDALNCHVNLSMDKICLGKVSGSRLLQECPRFQRMLPV